MKNALIIVLFIALAVISAVSQGLKGEVKKPGVLILAQGENKVGMTRL